MHRRAILPATFALLFAAVLAFHTTAARANDDAQNAQQRVVAATQVVHEMKQDPQLARLLDRAQGVFIVPRYGKGAFIVGGQGGGGVVLVKHDAHWSDPAFFDIGGGSIGLQAGGSSGAVAMLLMTPHAVHQFMDTDHQWSLHGGAGLTVADYNGHASAQTGGASDDVIVWSNVRGLYGGLTAGVTHIGPNNDYDHAYYQKHTAPREILMGQASNHHANGLRDALATQVASK